MHMYTKYEVPMSTLCEGEVCTDDGANDIDADDSNANDDGQSMIV